MHKQSSRHQVDEIRLSVSFVDRAKSRSYGWLTCCCSVNVQVVCKVLKIRELSSHNIHDVTQESLFSVCRASILELQISNKRLTKQLNNTGVSLATLQYGFHLPLLGTAIATTKYTATRIQKKYEPKIAVALAKHELNHLIEETKIIVVMIIYDQNE